MTWAACAACTTFPNCRPGRVRSTPGCWKLYVSARVASSIVQSLRGYRSPPSPRTAGGRPDYGSATLESWPWPALASTLFAVTGITNKSLRALMTGLFGTSYSINQASYDLARLSRNGIVARIPHRNLYALTPEGLRFAIFYTKVHDRVLRPLMARDQPQAAPPLRHALRVIDGELTRRLAAARLPAAA